MPIALFLYSLFGKGPIFNGRSGLYALQRLVAEAILSLMVRKEALRTTRPGRAPVCRLRRGRFDLTHEPSGLIFRFVLRSDRIR